MSRDYHNALRVLSGARQLVAAGWCQGAMYRGANGEPLPGWRPGCSCCALGAVSFAFSLPTRCLPDRAPGRTQAEVVNLFDRAIQLCKESLK